MDNVTDVEPGPVGPDEKELFEKEVVRRRKMSALTGQLPYFWNLLENYSTLVGRMTAKGFEPGMMTRRDFNIDADWRLKQTREEQDRERPRLGPAIVLGSGASLDCAIPLLNKARKKHKARIFCTPSQMWALLYQGVTPDYVVAHDPYIVGGKYLSEQAWADAWPNIDHDALASIRIITNPAIFRGALTWPTFAETGQMYVLRVANERFWEHPEQVSVTGYEGIEQSALSGYSEINNYRIPEAFGLRHYVIIGPSSTIMSAMLAAYLGHPQIYYVGYDLCHWKGLMRHHTYFPDGTESTVPQVPHDNELGRCEFAGTKDGEKFTTQTDMALGKRTTLEYLALFAGTDHECDMVEVVAEETPGELELIPRIGLDEFARGGTRKVAISQTRARILDTAVRRGWMDWKKIGFNNLPESTKKYVSDLAIAEMQKEKIVRPTARELSLLSQEKH